LNKIVQAEEIKLAHREASKNAFEALLQNHIKNILGASSLIREICSTIGPTI